MLKKSVEVCVFCNKNIYLKKDKYVLLGTYSGKKIDNESYFHFQCFRKHWEERVRIQAKNMVNKMANKVLPFAEVLAKGIIKK